MKWHGQLEQDRWVCEHLGFKRNGFFVDIGAGHPESISNTFVLERDYGWSGIAIEINQEFLDQYTNRPNTKPICADATQIDYRELFRECRVFPAVVDFLSIDLEPPDLSLDVLKRIPFDEYSFRCICFEHDRYRDGYDRKDAAIAHLSPFGYRLEIETTQDDFYVLD